MMINRVAKNMALPLYLFGTNKVEIDKIYDIKENLEIRDKLHHDQMSDYQKSFLPEQQTQRKPLTLYNFFSSFPYFSYFNEGHR